MQFQSNLGHIKTESNIHAPVSLNLLNWLQKSHKMFGKTGILSHFPNSFNNFKYTQAAEHSC